MATGALTRPAVRRGGGGLRVARRWLFNIIYVFSVLAVSVEIIAVLDIN